MSAVRYFSRNMSYLKNTADDKTVISVVLELAEREKKPPEASAPSRRAGMGVDD